MRLRSLVLIPTVLPAAATASSAPAPPVPPVLLAVAKGAPASHVALYEGTAGGACRLRFSAPGAGVASLSPNGRRLAYLGPSEKDVRVLTIGGTTHTVLRPGSAVDWVAWSSDGATLAVSGNRRQIWLVRADGSGARVLPLHLRTGATYGSPVFSPSGNELAVSTTWGNGKAGTLRNELDLVDLRGRLVRHLARAADAYSLQQVASWSPDGRTVAYVQDSHGTEIWLVGANGSSAHALTHRARGIGDLLPVWSPDGTRLAFASDRTGKLEVWVVNADGTGLQRLTSTPSAPNGAQRASSVPLLWTADGSQIVARRPDGFWLVPTTPGAAPRIVCRQPEPLTLDARFVQPMP
jgi:dipeptidyl aminopeptidase/acylaminoacyl peptidase